MGTGKKQWCWSFWMNDESVRESHLDSFIHSFSRLIRVSLAFDSWFAPEELWVCVAVAMPQVMTAVLSLDVCIATGNHSQNNDNTSLLLSALKLRYIQDAHEGPSEFLKDPQSFFRTFRVHEGPPESFQDAQSSFRTLGILSEPWEFMKNPQLHEGHEGPSITWRTWGTRVYEGTSEFFQEPQSSWRNLHYMKDPQSSWRTLRDLSRPSEFICVLNTNNFQVFEEVMPL